MTNTKMEKVKTAITKTKGVIAENRAKLRDLERQKIKLENDEIVALYRREKLNEDEFAALLRSGRETEDDSDIESGINAGTNINPSEYAPDGEGGYNR